MKLCARYKNYIIKSPQAVLNCNGYIPQQKLELDPYELDDLNNYQRDKRSDNGTDIEGSGEAVEAQTFEDSVSPADAETSPAAEETSPPLEPTPPAEPAPQEDVFAVAEEEKPVEVPVEEAATTAQPAPPAEAAAPAEGDSVAEEARTAEENAPAEETEAAAEESSSTDVQAAMAEISPDETVQIPVSLSVPDSVDGPGSDKPASETGAQTPELAGRSAVGGSNAEDEKAQSSSAADSSLVGKLLT